MLVGCRICAAQIQDLTAKGCFEPGNPAGAKTHFWVSATLAVLEDPWQNAGIEQRLMEKTLIVLQGHHIWELFDDRKRMVHELERNLFAKKNLIERETKT